MWTIQNEAELHALKSDLEPDYFAVVSTWFDDIASMNTSDATEPTTMLDCGVIHVLTEADDVEATLLPVFLDSVEFAERVSIADRQLWKIVLMEENDWFRIWSVPVGVSETIDQSAERYASE